MKPAFVLGYHIASMNKEAAGVGEQIGQGIENMPSTAGRYIDQGAQTVGRGVISAGQGAMNAGSNFAGGLRQGYNREVGRLAGGMQSAYNGAQALGQGAMNAGSNFAGGLRQGYNREVGRLAGGMQSAYNGAQALGQGAMNMGRGAVNGAQNAAGYVGNAIKNDVQSVGRGVINAGNSISQGIQQGAGAAQGLGERAGRAIQTLPSTVGRGIDQGVGAVNNAGRQMGNAAGAAYAEGAQRVGNAGRALAGQQPPPGMPASSNYRQQLEGVVPPELMRNYNQNLAAGRTSMPPQQAYQYYKDHYGGKSYPGGGFENLGRRNDAPMAPVNPQAAQNVHGVPGNAMDTMVPPNTSALASAGIPQDMIAKYQQNYASGKTTMSPEQAMQYYRQNYGGQQVAAR